MRADVIDKAAGNTVSVQGNAIDLSNPSIVRLDVNPSQIAGLERQGDRLIVRLTNGETITIENFYPPVNGPANDLVLREGDKLWQANPAAQGSAQFTAIQSVNDLLIGAEAAAAAGGGGSALLPAVLGVAGAAGGAAALSGGGSDSSSTPVTPPDTTPPAAPTATFSSNGTTVTGTGEVGAIVRVRDAAGLSLGTATVGSNGSYSVTLTQAQANGQTVTVAQADAAGNVSASVTARGPDITAPDAPTGSFNGAGTIITGNGEAGATVTIRNATGAVIGTGVVDAQGQYSVALTTPQTEGGKIAISQADVAGNVSATTSIDAPDTIPPAAPTAVIDAETFTVSGVAEPHATVTVLSSVGVEVGGTVAEMDGAYVVSMPPSSFDGGTITVTQTDQSGNGSPITVLEAPDLAPPDEPTVEISSDDDGQWAVGTGEPGATVTVTDASDDFVLGTGTVGPAGTFRIRFARFLVAGGTIEVTQTDDAGNVSTIAEAEATDETAPDAPTAAVSADGSAVTGTGEPWATVTVSDADGNTLGTAMVQGDGGYFVVLTPAQANGETVSVAQADVAGNISDPTLAIAPDITAPTPPAATISPDGTTVTGTGEAGATVLVRDPAGNVIGTAIVAGDGSYSVTLAAPQTNGELLTIVQSDAVGNISQGVQATAPDSTFPLGLTAAVDSSGTVVTGDGEPGATVTVRDNGGTVIGTATVTTRGTYSVALTTAQVNGETVEVRQADAADNTSAAVTAAAPDITAPAAPTATVSPDGTAVAGTGEANASLTVRDPLGNVVGTTTVAGDGSYTVTLTTPQANGETVTVRQADPTGNISPDVQATAPDITAPIGLTATVNATGTVVSGSGEAGATVTVRDPLGSAIGTAIVAPNGSYSAVLTTPQANGELLQVTQVDGAANPSTSVPALAPDIIPPAIPTAFVAPDGTTVTGTGEGGATLTVRDPLNNVIGTTVVAGDGSYSVTLTTPQTNGEVLTVGQADITGNPSPTASATAPDITAPIGLTATVNATGTIVTGIGEANATVTVRDPLGTAIGTAIVVSNGSYSIVLTAPQTNGELLQVTQVDGAANPSTPVPALAPDITPPAVPTAIVSPDGTTVTGTGEASATLVVRDPLGNMIGTTTVAGNGSYTVTLTTAQTNGEVLSVGQADGAGNPSPAASATAPDITAPLGLTATVNGDGTVVSGTGEAGATVTVRDPLGTAIGTAVVGGNGAYAVVLTIQQANGELLQVTQVDGAANPSTPVPALAPDITAPSAPTLAISPDGTTVTGSGEPGATVTINAAGGAIVGSGPVAGNGSFTIILTTPQANGGIVSATQADVAGNVSPPGSAPAPDITPPALPAASLDATGAVVTGTGEPGATIVILDPFAQVIGTGVVGAAGTFSIALSIQQINNQVLSVIQTDMAGNPSPALPLIAPDLTPPSTPSAIVAGDGASISGVGEPGATLIITDPQGIPIGSVTVTGGGTFTTSLVPPQINGELLGLVQTDLSGNASPLGSAVAPDLVLNDSPGAPVAVVSADGAIVFGTGDAGNTISVTSATGMVIGTATVTPGGTFIVILTTPQTNGEMLHVVQIDAEGDLSSPTTAVAPDLTPPAVPTASIDASGTTVTGTGEAGATIRVVNALGTVLGTATVNANGNYAVILASPQSNGQVLTAIQADAAANDSPPVTVTAPDATPPLAPTASVAVDGMTVSGTGEAGATIRITDSTGTTLGTATVALGGTYIVTLTTPQANGQTVTAVQTDLAGNASPSVTAIAPDITPPIAPTASVGASGLVVSGTGEAGATVTVRDALGTPIGSGTVAANGTYSVTLATTQTNGQALTVTQTDSAGLLSPSTIVTAPDSTAPIAPIGTVSADGTTVIGTGEAGATVTVRDTNGVSLGTALVAGNGSFTATLTTPQTNGQTLTLGQADPAGNNSPVVPLTAPDTTPPSAPSATVSGNGAIVTGLGEPGATVTVRDTGGVSLGTGLVAANGAYAVTLTTPQTNGQALQVTQADVAGNMSNPTAVTSVDTTAPLAPTGTVSADGAAVVGTGEPGATITVRDANGVSLGTALVAGNGSFTATLSTAQTNGQSLRLSQADVAGNGSPVVPLTAPDTTPPTAPAATVSGSGAIVTGTGEPGATVTVRDAAGVSLGTALVAANGAYVVTLTTPQANGQTLQVTQADMAGNVSGATPALAPDHTPPAAPSVAVNANGTVVTGIGEPGATVHIRNAAGTEIGTAVVAVNGTYTATLTTPQANGETISVTQNDPAGNLSLTTQATAPDVTPPAAPGVSINRAGTVVTGTGEAGATVEVRGAGGALLGTSTVAANGSFAVPLSVTQVAGQALTVSLRDGAGNLSAAAPITAPYDITAFDNTGSASITLSPVTTNASLGSANYLALVSLGLLNLNAQVLATPNVQFTVAPGHSLNASFSYDALLTIGVAAGYAVGIQRFDGTNWVSLDGAGSNSLLQLSLLNGDLVSNRTLGAGQYRAFTTFDGLLGVGLLGGLTVSGVDSDFTDVASVQPVASAGNVITDPGPSGTVDIASPQTEVMSVTVNGVTTTIAAGGSAITGNWGTLLINPNGSYIYTPSASAAAIGRVDSFTYTLIDRSDGELESATLTMTIGSPAITGAPIAVNDVATATATFANVVTTSPAAIDASFATPTALILTGVQTGTTTHSFTVGANSTSTVTLFAIQSSGLAVLPSYTITVRDSGGSVVGTITQTAVANLGLGTGVSLTLSQLASGTYSYTVSSTNILGTGYGTNVYVGQTVTHLDQHILTGSTTIQGELLGNDTLGTAFVAVRMLSGGSFIEVGETPLTLVGAHGTLTVNETGHYSYTPSTSLAYMGTDPVDSFSYQILQPNGTVATARIDVMVDINNGAAPTLTMLETHGLADAVPMMMVATEPTATEPAADASHKLAALALIDDGASPDYGDSVDALLGQFLQDHPAPADMTGVPIASDADPSTPIIVPDASVDDPLGYIMTPSDLDHDRHQLVHVV